MRGLISFMMIIIFAPVVFSIYTLIKRLREEPKDNGAREILLQAMCMEELKKKKNAEPQQEVPDKTGKGTSDWKENDIHEEPDVHEQDIPADKNEFPELDDDIRRSIQAAKETLPSADTGKSASEKQNDEKRKAAAGMVLDMMIRKGGSRSSEEELQEMIKILSDKNK